MSALADPPGRSGDAGERPGPGLTLALPDEAATARLGRAIAPLLGRGDAVLISGPLGAGKSALARAMIRARLGPAAGDVPSPSYTLVNLYDSCDTEIWHADLYRLSDTDELGELGIAEAWGRALVLVEWPERLGNELPPRRLEMMLSPGQREGRTLAVTPRGPGWDRLMSKLRDFA